MAKYKDVIIRARQNYYELCHTLNGCINPFAVFDTIEAAKKYADNHGFNILNTNI